MAFVLIADDDEIVREIARDALLRYGHGAGIVSDGIKALQMVKARRPDLLVLDCNMPGLSGVLVLRELRETPELYDLPVMILTGRRSTQDEELARYAGANDYMRKPFDPDAFVFRAEDLLATQQKFTSHATARNGVSPR